MRISDWSSDVCSSDLEARSEVAASPASGSGSAGSACLATEWSWVRRGLAPAAKTADPAATESTPVQRPCSRTAPTAQPNTGRIRLSLFKRELDRTGAEAGHRHAEDPFALGGHITGADRLIEFLDRKSTRLNSSH